MAKKKLNRNWLHDHLNDPYVKMAQREGYRARAAYKLKEIDEAERLIRPGMTVVDLGAAPGSWSQYLRARMAGKENPLAGGGASAGTLKGRIFALDLLDFEPIADVVCLKGDFREESVLRELESQLGGEKLDVVVSDMAPNLSGIESADMARIAHVCELALEFACEWLKPEGALVVKTFHGSGYSQIVKSFKDRFKVVKPIKPKASRDKSAETFILGRGLK